MFYFPLIIAYLSIDLCVCHGPGSLYLLPSLGALLPVSYCLLSPGIPPMAPASTHSPSDPLPFRPWTHTTGLLVIRPIGLSPLWADLWLMACAEGRQPLGIHLANPL